MLAVSAHEIEDHKLKTVNCFDNYKFTSDYFESFELSKKVYTPTESLVGIIKIKNINNYSLPNLDILANVWYVGDSFIDRPEGNDLIDEFFVARDVNLLPLASQTLFFKWQAPAKIKSGTYLISLYLLEGEQLKMAGLPTVPEFVGISTIFEINNTSSTGMFRFDKKMYLFTI